MVQEFKSLTKWLKQFNLGRHEFKEKPPELYQNIQKAEEIRKLDGLDKDSLRGIHNSRGLFLKARWRK